MVLQRNNILETYIGDIFDLDRRVWYHNDNPYTGRLPFLAYNCPPPPRGFRVYKSGKVEMICTSSSLLCSPNNTKLYTEWAPDYLINKIGRSKDSLEELPKKKWRLADLVDYLEEKIKLNTKGKLRLEQSLVNYHHFYLTFGVNAVFIASTDTEGLYDKLKSGQKIQRWGQVDFKRFQVVNQPPMLTPGSIRRVAEQIEEETKWFSP